MLTSYPSWCWDEIPDRHNLWEERADLLTFQRGWFTVAWPRAFERSAMEIGGCGGEVSGPGEGEAESLLALSLPL